MKSFNDVLVVFRKNNFISRSYSNKTLSKACDISEVGIEFFFNLSLLNGFISEPYKNIRFVKCLNHQDLIDICHLIENSENEINPLTTEISEENTFKIKSILNANKSNFLLLINRYEISLDETKKTHIHAIFYSLFDNDIYKIKDGIVYFEKKKLVSPNKLIKKYSKMRKSLGRLIKLIIDEQKIMIISSPSKQEKTYMQ